MLAQAGTGPNAFIEGSFSGVYGSMAEGEPSRTYTYSGEEDLLLATLDVELSFFTTFGSSEST